MKLNTYSKKILSAFILNIKKHTRDQAKGAMLALTCQCQCKCVHCGVALYKDSRKKELSYKEIIKLIDELKKLGVAWISFFGGEPLLIPQIFDYIK